MLTSFRTFHCPHAPHCQRWCIEVREHPCSREYQYLSKPSCFWTQLVSLKHWSWYPALIPFLWTCASVPDFIKFLEKTETVVWFHCSPCINHNLGLSWWKTKNSDQEAGKVGPAARGMGCSEYWLLFQLDHFYAMIFVAVASFQSDCRHKAQTQVCGDHIIMN